MRRDDLDRVASKLKEPMRRFVRESRVRIALLVSGSGQILAQHGFVRRFDVGSVAALAAAAHASSHALAKLTGAERWVHLHHVGQDRQLVLAPVRTVAGELIMVAIFDDDSTLGLVQLFFDRFVDEVHELEEFGAPLAASDLKDFEEDLEAGVERLLPTDIPGEQ